MNVEELNKLADRIEALPHYGIKDDFKVIGDMFNMSSWIKPFACGTIGCIGGWIEIWHQRDNKTRSGRAPTIMYDLGVDVKTSSKLFYPPHHMNYQTITPQRAAEVIRHLAKTGEVVW